MPQNEVPMTAHDVAKFFAALDPELKVYVRVEDFEDRELNQWYAYRFRFSVDGADMIIWEAEQLWKNVETLREFRRALTQERDDLPLLDDDESVF